MSLLPPLKIFWPDFLGRYAARSNAEYVNDLFANAGVDAGDETTLRSQLIAGVNGGTETRATARQKIAESRAVYAKLFNPAFVQMQYFGYLRRNPNDAPDGNFDGFNFWLNKLNQFNGDFIRSEMARAFIGWRVPPTIRAELNRPAFVLRNRR